MIVGETGRLQRLVETLLNFGRIEAGSAHYRFENVDAESVLRQVVGEIEPQAREAGVAIELAGPGHALGILADESALAIACETWSTTRSVLATGLDGDHPLGTHQQPCGHRGRRPRGGHPTI